MTQLSFSDLAELPRWKAKCFSSNPLPGTPEYQSMKEFEELEQRQRTIPKELATDLWWLEVGHESPSYQAQDRSLYLQV